ncbi:hypothetical protein ACYOEI_25965, partial [Singulisphaera rosea]
MRPSPPATSSFPGARGPREGLYDPAFEKDSCGVGFLADLKGRKSHAIVEGGLQILRNLQHRGACGCDQDTGDGAGILIQMPDAFFRAEAERLAFRLPSPGEYAVAFTFLPKGGAQRVVCQRTLEAIVREEGQVVIGWRPVPVDSSAIGWLARSQEPWMEQLLILQDVVRRVNVASHPEDESAQFLAMRLVQARDPCGVDQSAR